MAERNFLSDPHMPRKGAGISFVFRRGNGGSYLPEFLIFKFQLDFKPGLGQASSGLVAKRAERGGYARAAHREQHLHAAFEPAFFFRDGDVERQ